MDASLSTNGRQPVHSDNDQTDNIGLDLMTKVNELPSCIISCSHKVGENVY